MRTNLFNKHYAEQAVKTCNESFQNNYSNILDVAIAQIKEIDPHAEDLDLQLKHIKSNTQRDLYRFSSAIKTNMPKDICENAVLAAVDEAIALYKAGKPIV